MFYYFCDHRIHTEKTSTVCSSSAVGCILSSTNELFWLLYRHRRTAGVRQPVAAGVRAGFLHETLLLERPQALFRAPSRPWDWPGNDAREFLRFAFETLTALLWRLHTLFGTKSLFFSQVSARFVQAAGVFHACWRHKRCARQTKAGNYFPKAKRISSAHFYGGSDAVWMLSVLVALRPTDWFYFLCKTRVFLSFP